MEANGIDSMTQEPPATVDAKHRRSRGCLVRAECECCGALQLTPIARGTPYPLAVCRRCGSPQEY
jgi:hypothetical protein